MLYEVCNKNSYGVIALAIIGTAAGAIGAIIKKTQNKKVD
jgi:hypothetical protein